MGNNMFNVAYVRLSREDLNKQKIFSESIYNQLELIRSYSKSIGLKIDKEYIDDGFSGINFDRPGFEKLIDDIEKGLIGVIITKDMSRLGRNFIETAYYICEYFPKCGVRYISINDEFDSGNPDSCEQEIMLRFKSLFNDRYVKEISVKRKQIAESKTKEGQFIGFIAPYGYKIVNFNNKRTLEVDEYAARIVKRIFAEVACGKTRKEVAYSLNKDKIEPPVLYMNMTLSKNKKYYYEWSDKIIYRIIKNKTYTGKIIKRKSLKKSYLQKKREVIPIRDWETIDNCHPCIISEQLFNEANGKLFLMKRKEKNDYDGLFSGLVTCGECGSTMISCRKCGPTSIKYFFNCTKTINRKPCSNRTIVDSKLRTAILLALQDILKNHVNETEIVSKLTKKIINFERPNLKISYLEKNIELHNMNIKKLYLRKTKGEITLEQFLETKKNETLIKGEKEQLLERMLKLKDENIIKEKVLKHYRRFIYSDELMNVALRDLVDKIVVYKNNTLKIFFKFRLREF